VAAVIEALDLKDVILVAHSFSSGEAVRYLSRHGSSRISGVVFVAPAAIPFLLKTEDNPGGLDGALFEHLMTQLNADFAGWVEDNSAPYFAGIGSRAIIEMTLGMMTATSHQAMLSMAAIQPITDFRPELGGIDIPTLLVHGDQDASAPLEFTSRPAEKLIPGTRLIVYEGGPHGLYFTHKKRLNQDIVDFASELGA
jgi:non-heme chloroperoxidase